MGPIRAWAAAWSVGTADPREIDALGLTAALGLAGTRALMALEVGPDVVVLDGNHDWLTPTSSAWIDGPPCVHTRVRADRDCTAVAAASILAKVSRDAVMVGLADDFPEYGWARNKGYGTGDHLAALRRLGPSPHHRVTWRLPDRV